MDNTPFTGTFSFGNNDTSLPETHSSEDDNTQHNMERRSSTATPNILTNFHSIGSCPTESSEMHKPLRPLQSDGSIPANPKIRRKSTSRNLPSVIEGLPQKGGTESTQEPDPEDPWTKTVHKKRRFLDLTRWTRSFAAYSEEPPMDELARHVEHLLPCRANLPVQVYDFGEGKTSRKLIKLGDIELAMSDKPDWVVVRWIHAPLGIGLHHSSVEDVFLNGVGQEQGRRRRESKCVVKGKPFTRAGRAGWPYLESEIVNIRSFEAMKRVRNAALILKSHSPVRSILDKKVFEGDRNKYLVKDIQWRADHLRLEPNFWQTVQSDLPWLLSDGFLNMKSPAAVIRETNLELKRQTLQEHPTYQDAYIARDSFRCFHRADGYMLSLSPATGMDYLTRNLPDIVQDQNLRQMQTPIQDEKQDEELLWPEKDTSAIGQVYAEFENEGVSRWPQKNPEWLMVFLLTEIAITPHSIRSGYAIPSILDAYDTNVHKLIERKFEPWQKHETVSLVRSYLASRDELMALGQIYKNKLKFLRLLMEDCKDMESEYQDNSIGQQHQHTDRWMMMTGRVEFAISAVGDLSNQCDQLVTDLTASLNALFQLRSIEQNDRSITADSQSKAVFAFTAVTLVFLPLSFMTSYFSMNVEGIVDATPHMSQAHFWEICGPFTFCIVLIVGLYVTRERYRGTLGNPVYPAKS